MCIIKRIYWVYCFFDIYLQKNLVDSQFGMSRLARTSVFLLMLLRSSRNWSLFQSVFLSVLHMLQACQTDFIDLLNMSNTRSQHVPTPKCIKMYCTCANHVPKVYNTSIKPVTLTFHSCTTNVATLFLTWHKYVIYLSHKRPSSAHKCIQHALNTIKC